MPQMSLVHRPTLTLNKDRKEQENPPSLTSAETFYTGKPGFVDVLRKVQTADFSELCLTTNIYLQTSL